MTQLVKRLPCKQVGLSSNLQHLYKESSMMAHVYNPSTQNVEMLGNQS